MCTHATENHVPAMSESGQQRKTRAALEVAPRERPSPSRHRRPAAPQVPWVRADPGTQWAPFDRGDLRYIVY